MIVHAHFLGWGKKDNGKTCLFLRSCLNMFIMNPYSDCWQIQKTCSNINIYGIDNYCQTFDLITNPGSPIRNSSKDLRKFRRHGSQESISAMLLQRQAILQFHADVSDHYSYCGCFDETLALIRDVPTSSSLHYEVLFWDLFEVKFSIIMLKIDVSNK